MYQQKIECTSTGCIYNTSCCYYPNESEGPFYCERSEIKIDFSEDDASFTCVNYAISNKPNKCISCTAKDTDYSNPEDVKGLIDDLNIHLKILKGD